MINEEPRIKKGENEAEEEQKGEEEREKELAREACRKGRDEEQGEENREEEEYYCREHGKERQKHFETKTTEGKEISL